MTFTVRVQVQDQAGNATFLDVAVQERSKLRVGWCLPTGENQSTATTRLLGLFPGTGMIRLFRPPGSSLPPWMSGPLALIPRDCDIFLSVKSWTLPVASWWAGKPASWTGNLYFTAFHEPEQKTGSDPPTAAEYRQGWMALLPTLPSDPRFHPTPTFTEWYASDTSTAKAAEWAAGYEPVLDYPGVRALGMDVYGIGYPSYRTPEQMFGFALQVARRHQLPLLVPEWGEPRRLSDPGGVACAAAIRAQGEYLRAQPEAAGLCWWYDDTSAYRGILDDRLPEREALADLIGGF